MKEQTTSKARRNSGSSTLLAKEVTSDTNKKELDAATPIPEDPSPIFENEAADKKNVPSKKAKVTQKDPPVAHFPSWRHAPIEKKDDSDEEEALEHDTLVEIPVDAPPDLPDQDKTAAQNIFYRLRRKKELEAEQKMGEIEWIRKRAGFSDEDITLIFELGYDDELGRIVGYENLKKLKIDSWLSVKALSMGA